MSPPPYKHSLTSDAVLATHVAALVDRDPRLTPVAGACGALRLRTAPAGFEGLAKIVTGQQVSTASAAAIWGRVSAFVSPFTPDQFLGLDGAAVRGCGLTRGKYQTIAGIAEAITSGTLDLDGFAGLEADRAIAELIRLKGIGPWTAEVYLLFSLRHADIFPAGDLALQVAVSHALGYEGRLDAAALREIATEWAPYRGAAATLFWRYFAQMKQREGIA